MNRKDVSLWEFALCILVILILSTIVQLQKNKIDRLECELKEIDSVSVVSSIEADSLVLKIKRFAKERK
ncbi:MAG: hypothetical protein WC549_02020 [Actinomycetota bacterium]